MKVLIYGAKGWIGGMIVKELIKMNCIAIPSTLRCEDTEQIKKELEDVKPDRVICSIGRTHGSYQGKDYNTIDYLELPGKLTENMRDNLYAPLNLALLCYERNIHCTYLGTGCIFNYTDEKKIFTEEDRPNFTGSSYSTVKGYTDMLMKNLPNVLNLRIRMPICSDWSPRNLITKLIHYPKICSIPNSMTVMDDLIPILVKGVLEKDTGTYNLVNPGTIEHKEILELYKEIIDPTHKYELISYEEQRKMLLSDRSNNELDTSKLVAKYGPIPSIKDSVKTVMLRLKQIPKN